MDRECLFCGTVLDETRKDSYVCEECDYKIKLLKQITKLDSARIKIEKSVKKYLRKNCSYEKERDNVARKIVKEKFQFGSSDETCFALQLEKEHIRYFPNYKIGKYRVDFFLPDMKRIIEIDGELFHTDEDRDFIRERSIMSSVGEEYEIVRIPASYVPNYIIKNLREIIEFVVDKRKFDGRFRDTRWDKQYLGEYLNLQNYLRRNKR